MTTFAALLKRHTSEFHYVIAIKGYRHKTHMDLKHVKQATYSYEFHLLGIDFDGDRLVSISSISTLVDGFVLVGLARLLVLVSTAAYGGSLADRLGPLKPLVDPLGPQKMIMAMIANRFYIASQDRVVVGHHHHPSSLSVDFIASPYQHVLKTLSSWQV